MKRAKLEGFEHGDFIISEYIGNKKYKLTCKICGEHKEMLATNIKNGYGKTCSNKKKQVVDLTGQQIGEWEVLQYIGNKKYWCRCSCGRECEVRKVNLINGSSKSCGHNRNSYGNLIGQTFGDWTVIGKEKYKYIVKCSCGNTGYAMAKDLVSGKTKSCGHNTNQFVDITGNTYGNWLVLETLKNGVCKCQCQCENKTIKIIRKQDLIRGANKSCGCIKAEMAQQTLFERYGEIGPNRVANPRNLESINAIMSRDSLIDYIDKLSYKPTPTQLAVELELTLHRILTIIHNYKLEEYIDINSTLSYKELEVYEYINSLYDGIVIHRDRTVLNNKELDIYIPNKKLAIEFNGNYWHSDLYKKSDYHKQKTIECAKQNIQLIHIFEYEWDNIHKKDIIKDILKNKLGINNKIYARQCKILEISKELSNKFNNEYHLEGECNTSINIALTYNDEIVSLLSIDKPIINNNCEYEILRLAFKNDITIVGGTDKLFKYFIKIYKPKSVIVNVNISKFTGNVYSRIGFKPINIITEPNYIKYNIENGTVLSNINDEYNHIKIYDCGKLEMIWLND